MAITKTEMFDPVQKRTAEITKALAHPARIAILQILAERKNCICGDITDQLPLAQSTVSQHLKALKNAGIIKGEVEGVRTCYCLDEQGIAELNKLITGLIDVLNTPAQKNCC